MIFGNYLFAQSNFGIELRGSRNITFNTGVIEGEFQDFNRMVTITKEGNPVTPTYSIGAYYKTSKNHIFKLHFGWHQNGRIYDLVHQIEGNKYFFEKMDIPYHYYQITPSYGYQIRIGSWRFPIELGINVNIRNDKYDVFFIKVKDYNYDLRFALGIAYALTDHLNIGINGLFSNAIGAYQIERITGTYMPRQFGVEMSLMHDL